MIQNLTRPSKELVSSPALRDAIFGHQLPLEPNQRTVLQDLLAQAQQAADPAAIAYIAFALAYSYDHFEPYDHKAAVRYLDQAVNLYPNWPEAVFNRGVAFIHLAEYDKALRDLDRAEELHFPSPNQNNVSRAVEANLVRGKLLIFRAEALAKRGKSGDAERARIELVRAERALWAMGDYPSVSFWMSQIPERLNQTFLAEETRVGADVASVQSPLSFLTGVSVAVIGLILLALMMLSSPLTPKGTDSKSKATAGAKEEPHTLKTAIDTRASDGGGDQPEPATPKKVRPSE